MKLFNKKSRPLLVDQNILGEYMRQKYQVQSEVITKEPGEMQKIFTKIFYNIYNFIYNYFFIITILVIIILYLYNRYTWYQQIKKLKEEQKEKESNEIKTYFDNILSEDNKTMTTANPNNSTNATNATKYKLNNPNVSIKMDKLIGNNNNYLNHLKESFQGSEITNSNVLIPTSNMSIPNTKIGMSSRFGLQTEPKIIPNKTVRFIEEDFDAYGRNNINPKTGEILAFNENSNYSMF
jgi:hypothetical protein